MAFSLELLLFLTVVFLCNAERLPPPTRLSHDWLDPFTVNVSWSWKRPSNLPEACDIFFEYCLDGQTTFAKRTSHHYFIDCLTEINKFSRWNYAMRAVVHTSSPPACANWTDSTPVDPVVRTQKPQAELAKDFKCFFVTGGVNCSWVLVNQSVKPVLSFRKCGCSEELRKSLKKCGQYYTSGARDGCYLEADDVIDICIHVATAAEAMMFKPVLMVHPPKLTVKNGGENLDLSWQPPNVGVNCEWIYELCHTKCGEQKMCQNFTKSGDMATQIPYDGTCRYEFRSRVITEKACPQVVADFGDVVDFGHNKPPNRTLTVVAIIVPILLSVSVVLACYCFRRHSHIIFPTIPDPRVLLKEMMNGKKDHKFPTGNVYTPEPEQTESCKLVKENFDPLQNL